MRCRESVALKVTVILLILLILIQLQANLVGTGAWTIGGFLIVELRVRNVELRVGKVGLRVRIVELQDGKVELRVNNVELRVRKVEFALQYLVGTLSNRFFQFGSLPFHVA